MKLKVIKKVEPKCVYCYPFERKTAYWQIVLSNIKLNLDHLLTKSGFDRLIFLASKGFYRLVIYVYVKMAFRYKLMVKENKVIKNYIAKHLHPVKKTFAHINLAARL